MSASTSHVAHHFDDAEQQTQAAELGMWAFLATEVLFFGGIFACYALYRYWYSAAFIAGSHQLDLWLGALNTGILLTSSLMMALAIQAAQINQPKNIARFLVATIVLGALFLGIKGYEYHHKFAENLVPGPSFRFSTESESSESQTASSNSRQSTESINPEHVELFFSCYFALTGLHAIHMIIGIAILATLVVRARQGAYSAAYFTPLEISGLYWHFVDIIWVFLFPLLYLVR